MNGSTRRAAVSVPVGLDLNCAAASPTHPHSLRSLPAAAAQLTQVSLRSTQGCRCGTAMRSVEMPDQNGTVIRPALVLSAAKQKGPCRKNQQARWFGNWHGHER